MKITQNLTWFLLPLVTVIPGCRSNGETTPEADQMITVKVVPVEVREISIPVHTSGRLSARSEIKLSFKTGGIISRIHSREGNAVSPGTKMAELNLAEIGAMADQAGLGMEKAGRDLSRVKNLYRDSVATLEQLENARTAYEMAVHQKRIADFNLKYSVITAPSAGKVLKRLAEENEMIAAGHPVFLFAATENEWILNGSLTDRDIVRIAHGDSARITFDSYPDRSFPAVVSEMGNLADPYTGTFGVELTLKETDEALVSGFIGRADIYPSAGGRNLMIPVDALAEANEMTGYVFTVENNRAVRRRVELGGFWKDMLIVKSGVDSGMMVVTDGASYITAGSEIRISPGSSK